MQDIIPPINGQPRGAIRPPARSVSEQPARIAPREAIRPVRSIDGMMGRPAPVVPVEVAEPSTPVPAPVQLVSDVTMVPRTIEAIEAEAPTVASPTPVVEADTLAVAPVAPEPQAEPVAPVAPIKEEKPKKRWDMKRWFLIGAAVVLLGITGYVTVDTWMANNKAQATDQATDKDEASGTWTAAEEGQDETEVSEDVLAKYAVAPNLPRALYIDKLDIAARVLPMSVNTAGSIQAPLNINDSGWYTGSVKPGETGAVFIDGHASGPTRQGLFAYLDTLQKGDTLQVEKGDGKKLTYKVVHVDVVPLADIDMKKVLLPYPNVSKGLNLMTCTGKWLPKEYTYDHRVVVYTEQV